MPPYAAAPLIVTGFANGNKDTDLHPASSWTITRAELLAQCHLEPETPE